MFDFILRAINPQKISKKVEKRIDRFVKNLRISAGLFSIDKINSRYRKADFNYPDDVFIIQALVFVIFIDESRKKLIKGYKEMYFTTRGKYIGEMDEFIPDVSNDDPANIKSLISSYKAILY